MAGDGNETTAQVVASNAFPHGTQVAQVRINTCSIKITTQAVKSNPFPHGTQVAQVTFSIFSRSLCQ